MTRYIVVEGVGSDERVYEGEDRDAALRVLSEGRREMYELSSSSGAHELTIKSSIWLSGKQTSVGRLRGNRNVLMNLLEDSAWEKVYPISGKVVDA